MEVRVVPKRLVLDRNNATFGTFHSDYAAFLGAPVLMHDAPAGAPFWFVGKGTSAGPTQFPLIQMFNPAGPGRSVLSDNLSFKEYDLELGQNAGWGNFPHDMYGGGIATAYVDGSSVGWALIDVNRLRVLQRGELPVADGNTPAYPSAALTPNGSVVLQYQSEPLDTSTGNLLAGTLNTYVTGRGGPPTRRARCRWRSWWPPTPPATATPTPAIIPAWPGTAGPARSGPRPRIPRGRTGLPPPGSSCCWPTPAARP
jgi:hypothetical protein